jgi:hypothetical protein
VEPADAPIRTTPKSTRPVSGGQRLKSVLAKPVVVIIDTVLKIAWRATSPPARTSSVASATATTSDASASRRM